MLTDTTFWLDLIEERNAGNARGPVAGFLAKHRASKFYVSIVTWGEIAEGFAEHDHLDWFVRGIALLPLPRHVVWTGSRLQRELGSQGRRLGENDAWIAATALTWGKRLVTRDRAFSRVRRLTVVPY